MTNLDFLLDLNNQFKDENLVFDNHMLLQDLDSLTKMTILAFVNSKYKIQIKYKQLEEFTFINDVFLYINDCLDEN
jgi:acyl carrier protein